MEFKDSCSYINNLISKSKGHLISMPSGEEYSFDLVKRYNIKDIDVFESNIGITLPDDYKYFLLNVGVVKIYFDEYELGVEFIAIEKLQEFIDEVFVNIENEFPRIIIIASLLGRGDFIGYIFNQNTQRYELTTFNHEEPPEDWTHDVTNVSDFDIWFSGLVESEGEEDII